MNTNVAFLWAEGQRHGFPPCCRARFILSSMRPALLSRVAPGLSGRLQRLTPRHAIADGMVPCEAHLLLWLLTGTRDSWRKDLTPGMCCQTRRDLEDGGVARLERILITPEDTDDPDGILSESGHVWMMLLDGDDGISVCACPWCGEALP